MANTATYWKNKIGDYYMSNEIVQRRYELSSSDLEAGFSAVFSIAAFESILFYAVGYCIYVFELVIDIFKAEIQDKIDARYLATSPWWHTQALQFQRGDDLYLNKKTFTYEYATLDASRQIIKRVAVRESASGEAPCKVKLYVATESNGTIEALSSNDLELFDIYAKKIRPAGVLVECISTAGDTVSFGLVVNYNPLILKQTGQRITGTDYPVENAVNEFINTLNDVNFGGKLNLSKLIDRVQMAEGVIDVQITSCVIRDLEPVTWGTYASQSGWFVVNEINVNYQPQTEM